MTLNGVYNENHWKVASFELLLKVIVDSLRSTGAEVLCTGRVSIDSDS